MARIRILYCSLIFKAKNVTVLDLNFLRNLKIKRLYLTLQLIVTILPLCSEKPFSLGAYYESWSYYRPPTNARKPFRPEMIDPTLITDLFFAFAIFGFITNSSVSSSSLTNDFSIQPLDPIDQTVLYPEMLKLKKRSKGKLRLFLSIGGGNFNLSNDRFNIGTFTYKLFSQMVSTPENRKQFIESAISYAHKYGFDGIDIDWEYPGDSSRGGTEKDFEYFLEFISECSTAFHNANPPLLLSLALPGIIPAGVPQRYHDDPKSYFDWLVKCSENADRITIMTYNYHVPSDKIKITGANTPLFRDTDPSSSLYILKTIKNYIESGIKLEKAYLGLASFGWLYKGVLNLKADDNGPGKQFTEEGDTEPLAYFEIRDLIYQRKFNEGIDKITDTAYGYNYLEKKWVSFDTPETIAHKINEAKKLGLGGAVFWAIDLDEYQWGSTFPQFKAAQ
jgi:chitinase